MSSPLPFQIPTEPEAVAEGDLAPLAAPARVDTLLTRDEWTLLAEHMHNGNGRHEFVMGLGHSDGSSGYHSSKQVPYQSAVESSWDSLTSPGQEVRPFTAAPYSSDSAGRSRWMVFDFDAHGPDLRPRAEWACKKVFRAIRQTLAADHLDEVAIIVEDSGRGFHIFIIAAEFRSIKRWHQLATPILQEAVGSASLASLRESGIEVFPAKKSTMNSLGHAVRLPGTANPNTWNPARGEYAVSQILAAYRLESLLESFPSDEECVQRGPSFGNTHEDTTPGPPQVPQAPSPSPRQQRDLFDLKEARRLLSSSGIKAPSSRHTELCKLVGEGFYNFGRKPLRELATRQFEAATCPPQSSLDEHLSEFEEAYEGFLRGYPDRLSKAEQAILSRLTPSALQESFIIAQNFARHASAKRGYGKDGRFPFGAPELAARLGFSVTYADKMRRALVAAGCLRRVHRGRHTGDANMYVWLLPLQD